MEGDDFLHLLKFRWHPTNSTRDADVSTTVYFYVGCVGAWV